MGRYMSRLFLEYFDAGVERTFAYELIDQGSNAREINQNFGLLRRDGSEKPAFRALRNLIRLLADAGPDFEPGRLAYTLEGETEKVRHVLLQKRDGRFYLALWQAVGSYDLRRKRNLSNPARTVTVHLATPATTAKVYVPLEGSTAIATSSTTDRLRVEVPDHPVVIEIGR